MESINEDVDISGDINENSHTHKENPANHAQSLDDSMLLDNLMNLMLQSYIYLKIKDILTQRVYGHQRHSHLDHQIS